MRRFLSGRDGERSRLNVPLGGGGGFAAAVSCGVALLLSASVGAGAQTPTPSSVGAEADRDAIQALLDARAGAVLGGDQGAFVETIDPTARSFRRDQLRMFARARNVPFESYELIAEWERLGDLARPQDLASHPGAEAVSIPLTQERYRIEGFDEADAVEDLYLTFVKREGEWYVGADDDLAQVGLLSARHVWDFIQVDVTRSSHFLGLGPPCSSGPLCVRDLLELAEEALTRVDRYWKPRWSHRVVLIVPPSDRALKRMLQATFDPGKFVAFAYSTVEPETQRYTGHRIIVNPSVIAGRPRDDVLRIMVHELLHIATRGAAGPFIPLFVDEGFAEIAASGDHPGSLAFLEAVVGSGAFDRKLPRDYEFSTGSANDIFLSYQEAQSAISHFIDRWGLQRFTRFYRMLGGRRIAAGSPAWHVERTLRKTIDVGLRGFQESWTSSIDR